MTSLIQHCHDRDEIISDRQCHCINFMPGLLSPKPTDWTPPISKIKYLRAFMFQIRKRNYFPNNFKSRLPVCTKGSALSKTSYLS
ncbi:hypothetical protein CS542_04755 [Pedobacter sp. IW39]|nr:hypothetical protein CS542_04755 [Pedobacter sp. IW39]